MLVPLQHDKMAARRFPIITVGLIVLNVVVFLGTHWLQEDQAPQIGQDRAHILLLAATHPELTVAPAEQKVIDNFKEQNPDVWKQIESPNRDVVDAWDARMRMEESREKLQAEMDALCADYEKVGADSIDMKYAFVPAAPKPWAYVTANFLHGGWLHLIGNMWFLWLAGFVLEDAWGRGVYTAFYFVAGAAALQFHAWTNGQSMIPTLGASGAVAALMGAFLVSFPTLKIEMGWLRLTLTGLATGKMWYRFKAPAYALLPLWLLLEVFSGSMNGTRGGGVAHWAHVGGFLFGAVVAFGMRMSGLEKKLNAKVEAEVSWTSDAEIVEATEMLHGGNVDGVVAKLEPYLQAKPEMLDGWTLLREAQFRQNNIDGYVESTIKMCAIHLKKREYDLAWQCYGEFKNVAAQRSLPAQVWYDLCLGLEQLQNHDVALEQYRNLVKAYPDSRPALQAQMSAAKLCLSKMNRPQDAIAFYEAALSSKAPHTDLEQTIQMGLKAARKAAGIEEPAMAMAAPAKGFVKPLTWGDFDAPPVWGHGAKGDTIHKPDFSAEAATVPKE